MIAKPDSFPAIHEALMHVRKHHPQVCMVLFTPTTRWRFMDENGHAPDFGEIIDVSILEAAQTEAEDNGTIPELYVLEPDTAANPDTTSLRMFVVSEIMSNYPEAGFDHSLSCISWKYPNTHKPGLFEFHDSETGKHHIVTQKMLLDTFPLIRSSKWPKGCTPPPPRDEQPLWDDWLCRADATDFDAFVQLAIFGEVKYG